MLRYRQLIPYDSIIVRHGTAVDDVDERLKTIHSDQELDLTETGAADIANTAGVIRDLYFDKMSEGKIGLPFAIWSDDSLRCSRSAAIIADVLGDLAQSPRIEPLMRGWDQGSFYGKSNAEKDAENPAIHGLLKHGTPLERFITAPPGGESLAQMVVRMRQLHEKLASLSMQQGLFRVILVMHQVPSVGFMHALRDRKPEDFPQRLENPQHASVVRVSREGAAIYLHGGPASTKFLDAATVLRQPINDIGLG